MNKTLFHYLLAIVLLTSSLCMAQPSPQDADNKYATELVKPGTMAPAFKMKTPEGKTLQLKQFKGQYVLLDFWASWCPDCRKDVPNVLRIYDEFHPKGLQVVGISMDTDVEKWKAYIAKAGMQYPQVSELKKFHDTEIARLYGVKWIPSMVLIGKDGKVMLSTVLSDKMERTLTELFADTAPLQGSKTNFTVKGDHGRLACVLQQPELKGGQQYPVAIIMHGFGGNKESKLLTLIADSLQRRGIASVRFDFNGHGQSEGKFSDMTVPNEIEDAKAVYRYVSALPFAGNIYLAGHSQGGVVAAMTAGELGAEKVKKVALLAPAAVLRDDAIRGNTFGKTYDPLDPPDSVQLFPGHALGRNYIKTAFTLPIYETAARYSGSACIIHGTGDRVAPYTYGERFHQLWKNSEWHLLDAFDHGFSQNVYRAATLAVDFLSKEITPPEPQAEN